MSWGPTTIKISPSAFSATVIVVISALAAIAWYVWQLYGARRKREAREPLPENRQNALVRCHNSGRQTMDNNDIELMHARVTGRKDDEIAQMMKEKAEDKTAAYNGVKKVQYVRPEYTASSSPGVIDEAENSQ